ncbi:MAG: hypothetical protein SP1CHLAM54_14730 [Chlamydiia bacterium]|nr:hypothetical protein [Chlamydiia bacterium]MCH9616363.1 hypothetical protein [Chlamydiia bacterium]MCH9629651.1 hypothetical protein [Chlamydiia bacterium]
MVHRNKNGASSPTLANMACKCKAALHFNKLLILIGLTPFSLSALFNGNPALPEIPEKGIFLPANCMGGAKLGYQGDFVFKTDDHFQYQMHQGVLTANIMDRVEIFGSLGALKGKLSYPRGSTFHTDFNATWGAGGRVLLIYWNQLVMGVNGQFQSSKLDVTKRVENGVVYRPKDKYLHFNDWQVGVGFGYHLDWVVPYLGLCYHAPHVRTSGVKLNQEDPFSIYVGFTLTNDKYAEVSFEGRMIGENGISLSGNVRF